MHGVIVTQISPPYGGLINYIQFHKTNLFRDLCYVDGIKG